MRVAQLTCVYPPYGGGIGTVAYHFARVASEEHEVTVFTPRYNRGLTFTKFEGVKVEPLRPWFKWGNGAFLPQLAWRLREFDVVHLHYPFFGAQEFLPWLGRRAKLVVTYHMTPQAPGIKGLVFHALTSIIGGKLARRASLLTCSTRDYLATVARLLWGEPDKWRVLPYGVEEKFTAAPAPLNLAAELKLKPSVPVLLFVGTLDQAHAFKGLEVLLQALVNLKNQPWQLVVVGGGSWRQRFIAQAQSLGLGERVKFTGFVPDQILPDYYRLGNIFVLPSTSQAETFGLAALQAMASGLPVVASRLPGLREVVREGETGLLAQPGQARSLSAALDTLLQHPSRARVLGARAQEIVEQQYRWEIIGERLLTLYRQL
ncbi:MAG: glycosyltransferase family 4 protein [Candidatus Kerfeldbacteria bacterium]|nr:glycosyltransferase family 4 protein [Candidatus Kerfeldbacteria bacterium]